MNIKRHTPTRVSFAALALVVILAAVAASTASAKSSDDRLSGAGATFVFPLVSTWIPAYQQATGTQVAYASVGSGAGIAQITARTVDFGASDAPLSPDQAAACNGCLQIPWALSATAVTYHLTGLNKQLKLTGPVVANIYLSKITNWNDPAIKKLNPGLNLPDKKITVVHRSDGSGTTYNFVDYLSSVSKEWANKVGRGVSVNWPTGEGGRGNAGVANVVLGSDGTIGYNEISYALANKINVAAIQNKAGAYTTPGIRAISSAASTITKVPASNEMHIVNPPASKRNAYPISSFTYVIIPEKTQKAAALRKFVFWALTEGQKPQFTKKLLFVPIPKTVLVAAEKTLKQVGAST
jgi:phosphate transport system substrate-binding protein